MRALPFLALPILICAGCGSGGGGGGSGGTAAGAPAVVSRVDRDAAGGGVGGQQAYEIALSADGRYAAFASVAPDLVPGVDTRGQVQIYRKDLHTGAIVLVSRAWNTTERRAGGAASNNPSISGDGRIIVFESHANDLVVGDSGRQDVFAVKVEAGSISRLSVTSVGDPADGDSFDAHVSANGQHVAFTSAAANLDPTLPDTNGAWDVFHRSLVEPVIARVSVHDDGTQSLRHSYNPGISGDGRRIVFQTEAKLRSGDDNGLSDIYLRDLALGRTLRISFGHTVDATNGASTDPSISRDGEWIGYLSAATDLDPGDMNGRIHAFLSDRFSNERISLADPAVVGKDDGDAAGPVVPADGGRYVVFASSSSKLVPGDTNAASDIFVFDRATRRTRRVSVGPTGGQNSGASGGAALSADGSLIGFTATGTGLPGGETSASHVFVTPNAPVSGG